MTTSRSYTRSSYLRLRARNSASSARSLSISRIRRRRSRRMSSENCMSRRTSSYLIVSNHSHVQVRTHVLQVLHDVVKVLRLLVLEPRRLNRLPADQILGDLGPHVVALALPPPPLHRPLQHPAPAVVV